MATVYVSNTATNGYAVGSDGNTYAQAQNKATPKLTLSSALTVLEAGDAVIINGGIYVEPSAITPADINLTISAETGTSVTLKNNTAAQRVFHINAVATGITLNGITFDGYNQTRCISFQDSVSSVAAATFNNCSFINFSAYGVLAYGTGIQALTLANCSFVSTNATAGLSGVDLSHTAGTATEISGCTFNLTGNGYTHAVRILPGATGLALLVENSIANIIGTYSYGVLVEGCSSAIVEGNTFDLTGSIVSSGVNISNDATITCSSVTVRGNSIDGNGGAGYGILIGNDGTPAVANKITTPLVEHNTITSANHGVLLGHVTSGVVYHNRLNSCGIGVIGKSTTTCVFHGNTIYGITTTSGAMRAKGGTSDKYINNIVYIKSGDIVGGIACLVNANDSPVKASTGIVIKNNVMFCGGSHAMALVVTGNDAAFENNVYFSPLGESAGLWTYGETAYNTLEDWNAALVATDELFIAPLFFDAANGDLRIHNTSPLVAAGLATVTREPLSLTLENNTPGPLGLDATVVSGTTISDAVIKAPLGPEFQAISEWTNNASVDLSTLVPTVRTRIGPRGLLIYDEDLSAADQAKADKYLGVV